jgi:hypothetical protein
MAVHETLQARQAALLLHGLTADARARVLSHLTAAEAARLRPLLDELAQLGVPSSLSHEVQEKAAARATASLPEGTSARQRAKSLYGADVLQALSACVPVTVAAILQIEEWPWKQQVLDLFPDLRRAEIKHHLRSDAPALPPAVAEALCERLCEEAAGLELRWTR